jgi:hypothetical protein
MAWGFANLRLDATGAVVNVQMMEEVHAGPPEHQHWQWVDLNGNVVESGIWYIATPVRIVSGLRIDATGSVVNVETCWHGGGISGTERKWFDLNGTPLGVGGGYSMDDFGLRIDAAGRIVQVYCDEFGWLNLNAA